jgi:hypothetical protein
MMLIPAIPRQPAADLLAYAQEAVTIGRSLIAEGGRQDGDLRLPTLRHPRTPSKNRPHSFLSRGRTMRQVAGRSTCPGRSRRVLIAHRPKHASQRQDRGRKRKKLQGVRSCKIEYQQLADHREQRSPIYHLLPYLLRSARGQGCPYNRQFCDGRHSAGRAAGNMLRAILTDRGLRDGQRS